MIKRQLRRAQRGFTLIELMIVVAIIGILAAIAIPQYQDYVSRARWSDNLARIGPIKAAVAECAQNNANVIVVGTCDNVANLKTNGFLAANYTAPTPTATPGTCPQGTAECAPFLAGIAMSNTTAGDIFLTGTAQASTCTVLVSPTAGTSAVTWSYTIGGAAGCNRAKTGVGT